MNKFINFQEIMHYLIDYAGRTDRFYRTVRFTFQLSLHGYAPKPCPSALAQMNHHWVYGV
jgi:hypothetical protein